MLKFKTLMALSTKNVPDLWSRAKSRCTVHYVFYAIFMVIVDIFIYSYFDLVSFTEADRCFRMCHALTRIVV